MTIFYCKQFANTQKYYKHDNLPDEEIWMSKKVGIHFKQWPLFKDKSWQNDFCEIHANTDLR